MVKADDGPGRAGADAGSGKEFQAARDFLSRYRSLAVTSHLSPDGDAIGSQIGLMFQLLSRGTEVIVVNDDRVPPDFSFLEGSERLVTPEQYEDRCRRMKRPPEAAVFLECCAPHRAGRSGDLLRSLPLLNIDHHFDNSSYGTVNLVVPEAAACGEIIYHLFENGAVPIGPETAAALYTAVLTDTSFFRFNCRAGTLRTAAALVEAGADPELIASSVYERVSPRAMLLLAQVLRTLRQSPDGRITWCRVERRMYRDTGADDLESEGFIDYLRVVGGSRVTFILKELPGGKTRVNLRSKGDVDVQRVASLFKGGGHRNAAGCTINTDIDRAEKLILREMQAIMNE